MEKLIEKAMLSLGCCVFLFQPILVTATANNVSEYSGSGSVTQGIAKTVKENLFYCQNGVSRIARIGEIKDKNGNIWIVPAVNQFESAMKATDLYEQCAGVMPTSLSEVDTASVPIITVDPDGDVITGYIFADNYFELYINGKLIAVDSVPFTPFNSSIVKFRVSKPYAIAVKVIDWEENLGVGTESNRGHQYHPGDGGFIASFSDGTVTNNQWKAQTFYTSPISDLNCLSKKDGERLSQHCLTKGSKNGENAYAIHWQTPEGWMERIFNADDWPYATIYSENEIGVNNKPAYMNFREKFTGAGADFIWSTNVVLDNEVLLKYTVK